MMTLNDRSTIRHSLVLLMAASFISGCSHTGAVHYANDDTVNPDGDVIGAEQINEMGVTHIGPGGGFR